MQRQEYKYLVPVKLVPQLKRSLEPYTEYDKFSKEKADRNYTVRSIYFDTLRLDFYHDKIAGLKRRKKLRVRGYNEEAQESVIFLEIKRKNSGSISKSRAPVPFKDLTGLIDSGNIGDPDCIHNTADKSDQKTSNFLFHLYKSNLRPTIKIIYEREAYFYKFNNSIRLTIDKNLRSSLVVKPDSLFNEEYMIYSLPGYSILEVKLAGEIPLWIQDIIAHFQLKQQAISKYTICIDDHSPYEPYLRRTANARTRYNHHKNYKNWEIIGK